MTMIGRKRSEKENRMIEEKKRSRNRKREREREGRGGEGGRFNSI